MAVHRSLKIRIQLIRVSLLNVLSVRNRFLYKYPTGCPLPWKPIQAGVAALCTYSAIRTDSSSLRLGNFGKLCSLLIPGIG